MPSWHNWSGRRTAEPSALHFVRSEEDACAIARQATEQGTTLRVVGSGHSHSLLVPTTGALIDLSGMSGVISADREGATAWIRAGSTVYSLGQALHDAGLALRNQGDIDRQAIGGACATGTHGTGQDLRCLSAAVLGARIATADGRLVECDASNNPDLWEAARLHLGALGIVTALRLDLRPSYRVAETGFEISYDELAPQIDELNATNERFEFFWYPGNDRATAKATNPTSEPARYPLAAEGARCAWSYEVLSNHRPHQHTEMEYSVPAAHGPECFARIRQLLTERFTDVRWPVEYRTVAADDVWLSMASQRPTVTISVHQDIRHDDTEYFTACEEIFGDYAGRPHWGKVNYVSGPQLAELYPHWHDWWRARDRVDPQGTFLNDYLRGLAPETSRLPDSQP